MNISKFMLLCKDFELINKKNKENLIASFKKNAILSKELKFDTFILLLTKLASLLSDD